MLLKKERKKERKRQRERQAGCVCVVHQACFGSNKAFFLGVEGEPVMTLIHTHTQHRDLMRS